MHSPFSNYGQTSHPLAEGTYADEPRENGAIPQVKGGWKQDDIVARNEIPRDLGI